SGAEFLVVENERYLRMVLAMRERLPKLRHLVVVDAPATLPDGVVSFEEVLERGAHADEGPYWDRVNALKPEALATLVYTARKDGRPKGVMLSHRNLAWTACQFIRTTELGPGEVVLSYLPLSHIAEQIVSLYGALALGVQVYFSDSLEGLSRNLREVRPT